MVTECKYGTSACFGLLMISSDIRESRQFGFWIPCGESRIPGIAFQYLSVELGVWNSIVSGIPDTFSCIPHSKAQDSGFHKKIPLHGAND